MEYKYFGWDAAPVKPVSDEYQKIGSLQDLYDALLHVWCEYTCAPRLRDKWNEDDKTVGQCSVTAFLVQDIFGGEVYGIPRPDGAFHCYNRINDITADLTSEQFGDEKLVYENNPLQSRQEHFSKEEKRLRYEYLKSSLKDYLDGQS